MIVLQYYVKKQTKVIVWNYVQLLSNPSGSNVVVLDFEQVEMCSGNDEVTTMVFE